MTQALRQMARRLKLGPLALQVYHTPRGFVKKCAAEGPVNLYLARQGRFAMEEAAAVLPPLDLPRSEEPLHEIHFLTGEKFWYQTLFCAYSFMKAAGRYFTVVLYDDGTLGQAQISLIQRVLPSIRVISIKEINERIDAILPEGRFPTLRERRINYPHIRKLTDVHAGQTGWKLVLDSDMLFFNKPEFLENWLRATRQPCHMVDVFTCYGYSIPLMEELTGRTLPERLNVGICGLRSEEFNWEQLEEWTRVMIEREGTSYFQEQALTAMLLAGRECAIAPERDYICKPAVAEVLSPGAVLHHYVADSKNSYFRFGWKHIAAMGSTAA